MVYVRLMYVRLVYVHLVYDALDDVTIKRNVDLVLERYIVYWKLTFKATNVRLKPRDTMKFLGVKDYSS